MKHILNNQETSIILNEMQLINAYVKSSLSATKLLNDFEHNPNELGFWAIHTRLKNEFFGEFETFNSLQHLINVAIIGQHFTCFEHSVYIFNRIFNNFKIRDSIRSRLTIAGSKQIDHAIVLIQGSSSSDTIVIDPWLRWFINNNTGFLGTYFEYELILNDLPELFNLTEPRELKFETCEKRTNLAKRFKIKMNWDI